MNCKICNGDIKFIFSRNVLSKYKIQYFQCNNCNFIQTEDTYWIREAYEFEKSELDVGLIHRNLILSQRIENILPSHYEKHGYFLDFAGGNGMMVRLMRDKGFEFLWIDKYSKNIFARFFEFDETLHSKKIQLVTAFEVLEHFVNPMEELETIFKISRNILFSTELIPNNTAIENWWYLVPEGGQHVAFYDKKTFSYIANKFHLNFYTNGYNLHLLTDKVLRKNPFDEPTKPFLQRLLNKIFFDKKPPISTSLLSKDFEYVKMKTSKDNKISK